MCEWLSHAEWCDVQIVCGGHSFSAHKAVLASASNFLRHILLSFPSDESAISIVLPDFDLDAMTSVLSYIYNGEVKLDNQKLGLFFDIVNALQIFVDCQYLPEMLVGLKESKEHYLNTYCKKYQLVKDVFTLAIDNEDNKLLYNIKRCSDTQSIILQYTRTETEFQDGTARCQNESESSKSRLGNLKSSFGDRQRNSFLRDLFIETYPQNGNVNGRAEGVLAISNECYHSPASALSTNANGKHLGDDALSTTYKKSTNYSLHSQTIFHNDKQPFCTRNCNEHAPDHESTKPSTNSTNIFIYRSNNDCNDNFINSNRIQDLMTHSNMNNSFSTINFLQSDFQQCMMKFKMARPPTNSSVRSVVGRLENSPLKTLSSPKVIYNRVLQSPWCSRKPNDFRPFRRKVEKGDKEKQITEEKKVMDQNDDNNNVQSKPEVDNSHKMLETAKQEDNIKEASDASGHNSNGDSFTCSHCNQVMTSSESLAVHTRRHLTAARYSCSECGKTFSQLRNFKYHMSIHRGTREFAATCTVCGKYFNDRGYLSSHMKIHRNRKEYKCTQCPKSFNQRVAYNMHVRIHTGVKPHVCDECGKAFSRKMLLKQHQRTHSGERPYACPHCDKRFADRSNMTLHLRLHTGVKPFSCTMCPKSFTKKHHLKSHLNFHTGSKPYSCPRCKLAFTQSSNMRTHMKKCNAPLPSEGVDTAVIKINEVN